MIETRNHLNQLLICVRTISHYSSQLFNLPFRSNYESMCDCVCVWRCKTFVQIFLVDINSSLIEWQHLFLFCLFKPFPTLLIFAKVKWSTRILLSHSTIWLLYIILQTQLPVTENGLFNIILSGDLISVHGLNWWVLNCMIYVKMDSAIYVFITCLILNLDLYTVSVTSITSFSSTFKSHQLSPSFCTFYHL